MSAARPAVSESRRETSGFGAMLRAFRLRSVSAFTWPQHHARQGVITHRRNGTVSQRELALRAGIDTSYVCLIENGRAVPTREIVSKLARALALDDVDHDRLMIAAGYWPPTWNSRLTCAVLNAVHRRRDSHQAS